MVHSDPEEDFSTGPADKYQGACFLNWFIGCVGRNIDCRAEIDAQCWSAAARVYDAGDIKVILPELVISRCHVLLTESNGCESI
jgi:hypothetical protein